MTAAAGGEFSNSPPFFVSDCSVHQVKFLKKCLNHAKFSPENVSNVESCSVCVENSDKYAYFRRRNNSTK